MVCIEEGRELGRVGSLLIDPEEIRLAGFTLSVPDARSPVKVVPVEAISSFGTFALTVGKSDAIADLAGNEYFLSLFEKDIVLLGTEVRDTLDKLIGFVKDAHMDPATGALLRIRITSDKGFLSPYNATLPVSVIRAMQKDRVIIDQDHVVAYHKESHLATTGEESRAFVPLVTHTDELKETVREYIGAELEKVRKELHDYLFQQHEEYFVSRERKPLEQAVTDAVRQNFDTRILDIVNNALLDYTRSLPAPVPLETFDDQIRQLRDSLEQAVGQVKTEAEQRAARAEEQAAGFIDNQKQAAAGLELSLKSILTAHLEHASGQTRDSLASLEQQIAAATGPLAGDMTRLEKSLLARLELAESVTGDRTAETDARIERLHSVFKDEIAVLRNEIEERIHATMERVNRSLDSTRQDHSDLSDSIHSLLLDMESRLHQRVDKQIADRMTALESKLTQTLKQDQTHTAAFVSRLSEQNELAQKTLQRTSELESHIASLNSRLQSALSALDTQLDKVSEESSAAALSTEQTLQARLNSLETTQSKTIADLEARLALALDKNLNESCALTARLESLEAAQKQARMDLNERTTSITTSLTAQLSQWQDSVNSRFASIEENWTMADAAMTEGEQAARAVRDQIETLKQQIQTLAADKPGADALRAAFEERLDQAVMDFDFLKNALGAMQQVQMSVIDREAAERSALQEQIQALSLKSDESAQTLSLLGAAVDGLKEAVSTQNTRNMGMTGALEERIDHLRDGFDELRGNGLHALQRLASVEIDLHETKGLIDAATTREELNTVTDSLARLKDLDLEIDGLKSMITNLDKQESMSALESGLAALRELAAQNDQERGQSCLAALDRVRADMDERIRTMHQEISAMVTQGSESVAAHTDSEIQQVRRAIEKLNSRVESQDGLSADHTEALIQEKLDAALAHFTEQSPAAVTQEDIQELEVRFRELLKDKVDTTRDLLLGALDGRIDELKSHVEAARIENLIDDSVQKSLDALHGQIKQALDTAGAAAPRSDLDALAETARKAEALAAQQKSDFDAAIKELDARFQNLEDSLCAKQAPSPSDTITELRQRLADLEASAPEAAALAQRLESLQSAADSITDAETRLTRKVKDVQESTEILSGKLNALLGKSEFDEEKQEILQLLDDKTARLETGLKKLHEHMSGIESPKPVQAAQDPDLITDQLDKQIAAVERRIQSKSEKAVERALTRIQEQMQSLGDELAENTRQQIDEAISAVNTFQARFMSVSDNIEHIEMILSHRNDEPGQPDLNMAALEKTVTELRARFESVEQETAWAAHTVQDLASSPIGSMEQTLARQEHMLKDMAARLDGLGATDNFSRDAEKALQMELDEINERFAALENRIAVDPEDFCMRLEAIEEQIKQTPGQTPVLPAGIATLDLQAVSVRLEAIAQSQFDRLCAHVDHAVDQKTEAVAQRIASIQMDLENLHALKDGLFQTAVEPGSHTEKSLDAMENKLRQYEELMEEESEVVNRLLDEVGNMQALMTRTRETAASREQLQALAVRVQEMQAGMERMVEEIASRAGGAELVDRVHRDILDTLRTKGLRELIFPARDLFTEDDALENETLPPEITEDEAVSIFGDRLTRNILGGRVAKDIFTDDNRCIVRQGSIVDNELIQRAKQHGKFLELTLNVDSDSV